MMQQEQKIWDLVHSWCNEQGVDIPDMNRRKLMDAILNLNDSPELILSDEECKCIRYVGGNKWYSNGCTIHTNQ